jgi:hypothetical protein
MQKQQDELRFHTEDTSREQVAFLNSFKQQHNERMSMQQQLSNLGITMTISKIDVDYCDQIVLQNGTNTFEASVMVQIHLDLQEFGNAHENVGYGIVTNSNRNIALLMAKHEATKDAVQRGMRMFNEGGDQLSQHAKYKNQ